MHQVRKRLTGRSLFQFQVTTLLTLTTVFLSTLPVQAEIVDVPAEISAGNYTFLGGNPTRWLPGPNTAAFNTAGIGTPGAASFSFMPAGTLSDGFDPHGGAGTPTSSVTGLITGVGSGTEAAQFNAALEVWAAVSGFTNLGMVADSGAAFNTPEPGPGNTLFGDIRVGAIAIDGAGSVLAHGYQPGTAATFGGTPTLGGDIHLDAAETWIDVDAGGVGGFDFFTVVLHEIGHALGLGHSNVAGSVMLPTVSLNVSNRTLSADDIAGIQALYGPSATAVPEPSSLVLFGIGGLFLLGCAQRNRRKLLRRP